MFARAGPDAPLADLDPHGRAAGGAAGLSQERVEELARQALPNVALGSMVIVPIWCLAFLLRPPRRSSD
jgi:hypothetical protein